MTDPARRTWRSERALTRNRALTLGPWRVIWRVALAPTHVWVGVHWGVRPASLAFNVYLLPCLALKVAVWPTSDGGPTRWVRI